MSAVTWQVHVHSRQVKLADDARLLRGYADRGGSFAEWKLGLLYAEGIGVPKDLAQAVYWYRKSADQSNPAAYNSLAYMYLQGEGVLQDSAEAIRLYKKAADQGDSNAEYNLGSIYRSGLGVTRDYVEARRWYQQAANKGNADAHSSLGYMLYNGLGTPENRSGAAGEYRIAADMGLARAQYDLAFMDYYGLDIPQNRSEAYRLFYRAAGQGEQRAARSLADINRSSWMCSVATLSIGYLGSVVFLIGTFLQRDALDFKQYRLRWIAAIFGLLYPSLGIYSCSSYRIIWSEGSEYIISFADSFLFGAFLSLVLSIYFSRLLRAVPGVITLAFIGINLFAFIHSDLRASIPATRAFFQANGLVCGLAISLLLVHYFGGDMRQKRTA